jgi:hypothetical protein
MYFAQVFSKPSTQFFVSIRDKVEVEAAPDVPVIWNVNRDGSQKSLDIVLRHTLSRTAM